MTAVGVALTDWDFDGRVDIWVTNRTAPRVRLLHNETRNDHHFPRPAFAGNHVQPRRHRCPGEVETRGHRIECQA